MESDVQKNGGKIRYLPRSVWRFFPQTSIPSLLSYHAVRVAHFQDAASVRISIASPVAWLLFLMVFSVTMFNWKFGNCYTNE